ncbi:MAG: hypothetical protein QNK37_35095 [Acidobacteriota bacterium]|nr:hypothetical protein [Acidobacteriota bacterium]
MTFLLLSILAFSDCSTVNLMNFAGRMGSRYAVTLNGSVTTVGTNGSTVFSKAMAGWAPCSGMTQSSDASKALHFDVYYINAKPQPDANGNNVLGTTQAWESMTWTASDGSYSQEFATEIRIKIWTQDSNGNQLSEADLVGILMHELGHGFGLDHSSGCSTAIMAEDAPASTTPGRTYQIAAGPLAVECDEVKKIDNDDPWDESLGSLSNGTISNGSASGGGGGGLGGGGGIEGNLCSSVACPPGHECTNGACMPDNNGCVVPCPSGYTCSYGVCVGVSVGDPDCDWPFDCSETFKTLPDNSGFNFISLGRGLMLAVDFDHDGKVTGRREVFRGHTDIWEEYQLTPWEALARFDEPTYGGNNDGFLDHHDLIWKSLRVHDMDKRLKLKQHPEEIGLDYIELP